jgi:type IV secretory pathway TrbD component
MDDGPRTGGLQALLLIIGATAAYVTFGAGSWGAAPFMVAAFGAVIWLELYARRRVREEEAERRRRLRERAISHLDFEEDPFDWR